MKLLEKSLEHNQFLLLGFGAFCDLEKNII